MNRHERIDYLEYPAVDLEATKAFFTTVFAWQFTDYGEDYTAFTRQGGSVEGGFYRANLASISEQGAALAIFFSDDLVATQIKIEEAGGLIVKPIFDFPGGQRFHFTEPSGNEFAVWTDV